VGHAWLNPHLNQKSANCDRSISRNRCRGELSQLLQYGRATSKRRGQRRFVACTTFRGSACRRCLSNNTPASFFTLVRHWEQRLLQIASPMPILPYAEIDRSGALNSEVMRRTATPRKPRYRPSMSVKPNMNTAARNTPSTIRSTHISMRPVEAQSTLREFKRFFDVFPMPRCVSAASSLDG
jgi:hypothetical protein